jgi:hypothetical protein
MKKEYVAEDLSRMIDQGKELLGNMKAFYNYHSKNKQELFKLVEEDSEVRNLTIEFEKVLTEISI